MTRSTDLIDEVNILRRELEKLELEKRIAELKAEPTIDEGLETIVKKQNQTLLHIKAELEAAKQFNPFDLVLISGSIENISNIVDDHFTSVPTTDEWDGCVGCCKVVDVAAGLQEELDECNERCTKLGSHNMQITANLLYRKAIIEELKTDNSSLRDTIDQMAKKWSRDRATIKNFKTIETRETDGLHKTILDMDVTISDLMDNDRRINGFLDEYRVTVDTRDKTIEELHTKIWELERTLPANFWDVVAGRDATIRKQRTTIEDYKETIHVERMDRVIEKESINRKFCEDLRKLNATIEELKDRNAEDLHELYDIDRTEFEDMKTGCEIMFRNYLNTIAKLQDDIKGLDAELSARKHDSEVLKKVVEIVKNWDDLSVVDRYSTSTTTAMRRLYNVVKDYTDAPEGPPETPIDEPQEITVTFAYLELP